MAVPLHVHSWYSLLEGVTSPRALLSAVVQQNGLVLLLGVGTDGTVQGNWLDGTGWHNWHCLGGSFPPGASLSAVVQRNGVVLLTGVNTDGIVQGNRLDGTGWHNWHRLGGSFLSGEPLSAVVQQDGIVLPMGVGTDSTAQGNWLDASGGPGRGAATRLSGSNCVVESLFDDQPADKAEPVLTVERLALQLYPTSASASAIPLRVSQRLDAEALLFDSQASSKQLLQPLRWLSAAELDLLTSSLMDEL